MIFHAALPADEPERAARVVAKMLGGEAMPFPPGPESWMAWSADGSIELEFTPRGREIVRGDTELEYRVAERHSRASDWHIALGTVVAADEIVRLATEAGWPARICHRATFFRCVEVWVEGAAALEILDPSMQAEYRASMTPENWKKVFGVKAA
ncbi:MAG: hypothetical protein ABW110_04320 [Steroidobacteraceae bacterium]